MYRKQREGDLLDYHGESDHTNNAIEGQNVGITESQPDLVLELLRSFLGKKLSQLGVLAGTLKSEGRPRAVS